MAKTHIMLQGFGSFPINFKALIECTRELNDPIEWSIICTSGHYVEMYKELLGPDAVLYLHSDMKNYLNTPDLLDQLSSYHGSIYYNIEAEKRYTKHKKAMRQLKSAAAMYLSMKNFILKRKPTHILFGQIEGMDGMTFVSVGRELNIQTLVPSHTRHLGETFFAPDSIQTLPENIRTDDKDREKAAAFLNRFRSGATSAAAPPPELADSPDERYVYTSPSMLRRSIGKVKRFIAEPEMREPDVLRASILLNFHFLARILWGFREIFNKRIYDIDSLDQLPKRFVYYPLQYSPESSINSLAPYYVDQMRAIDAIRLALPSNMFLVVKEHPACLGLRKLGFLNSLQKKAGIIIARADMPSRKITEKANLTLSVTGTASLEAFLLGKPSLIIGGTFFASFLGGPTGVDALPQRIARALTESPSDERIIDALAKLFAISRPFILGSPFDQFSPVGKYSLNKTNINNFYNALKEEIDKSLIA